LAEVRQVGKHLVGSLANFVRWEETERDIAIKINFV
jgi:hypothetical protein